MRNGNSLTLFMLCMSANWAVAQDQPVYDPVTETLTIPSVAIEGQSGHFQDVLLEPAGDGLWRLARAHDGVLLSEQYVEEVWTTSTTGVPRQFFIHIAGTFPHGCPEVGRIEHRREGNTFQVYVYYKGNAWLRDPTTVLCTQALKPFEITIPLNIYGLPAGEYSLNVNNHALRTFVVDEDNVGQAQFGGQRREHCQYEPRRQSGWMSYGCTNGSDVVLQ